VIVPKDRLGIIESSDFFESLQDIPNHFATIFSNAVAFLITICFAIGVVLAIIGAIKWATGWDERDGKKTVVKGVVLIALSLIGGSLGIGIATLTG